MRCAVAARAVLGANISSLQLMSAQQVVDCTVTTATVTLIALRLLSLATPLSDAGLRNRRSRSLGASALA